MPHTDFLSPHTSTSHRRHGGCSRIDDYRLQSDIDKTSIIDMVEGLVRVGIVEAEILYCKNHL